MRLISSIVQASANTQVALTVVSLPLTGHPLVRSDSGVVRVDVQYVIRPVIHHFEANLDGHERTYIFHVRVVCATVCVT